MQQHQLILKNIQKFHYYCEPYISILGSVPHLKYLQSTSRTLCKYSSSTDSISTTYKKYFQYVVDTLNEEPSYHGFSTFFTEPYQISIIAWITLIKVVLIENLLYQTCLIGNLGIFFTYLQFLLSFMGNISYYLLFCIQ